MCEKGTEMAEGSELNAPALFVGAFVLTIAWFRMDLLIDARSCLVILVICIVLFTANFVLYGLTGYSYWVGALLCPL
jgi:hypothetical protein